MQSRPQIKIKLKKHKNLNSELVTLTKLFLRDKKY